MKHSVCVAVFVLCLAACNKGPAVKLDNASAGEVASAVKQSGVMSGASMIEPGLWQSKVTIAQMDIPGLPPQYADKMKESIAKSRERTSSHCITKAEVNKPKEDFFGAGKSCKYRHFAMGGGKIDIQMVCSEEGATQTTNMSGSYTPTRYSMDMTSSGSGSEHNGMSMSMNMKMHVDAQRVGECTGSEG